MALTPDSLLYTTGEKTTRMRADVTTYITHVTNGGVEEESETEVRPELVRLTRTETSGGTTTIGQTQIAAKSASFGGVVTVQGDLKVEGALRVPQRGDIDMGEFTTTPAGVEPP